MITGTIDLRDKRVLKIMTDIKKVFVNMKKMFYFYKSGFYASRQGKIHKGINQENRCKRIFENPCV